MFMPKKHFIAVYAYLFKEGAIVCDKDVKLEKHCILDLPNLHVSKALLSLKSRGYVREVFNWQTHYYFLTDEGVTFLRKFLNIPEDINPATIKTAPVAVEASA